MGVIYELLKLPRLQREKLVDQIVHQEANEKLESQKIKQQKIKSGK